MASAGASGSATSAAASGSSVIAMSGAEVYTLRQSLPRKTVATIKGILRDLSCAPLCCRLGISGNKPELITRLSDQLESWYKAGNHAALRRAKELIECPRDARGYPLETSASFSYPYEGNGQVRPSAAATASAASAHGSYHTASQAGVPASKYQTAGSTAGRSAHGPYGSASSASSYPSAPAVPALPTTLRFKPSPFWKIEQFVTSLTLITEARATDRKSAFFTLRLNPQHVSLLKEKPTQYQIRLFCTTKMAAGIAARNPSAQAAAYVEFPASCDLRINGEQYKSSLKGSKKSPGRVPPPNLNKDRVLSMRDGLSNRIELIYTNTPQKYLMGAALCSYTTPEAIVDRLKKNKTRSRAEIVGSMKRAAAEDDFEIGTATLSLRDPLSYTRITAPCRSIQCQHSQCFDAAFFFMSNEQAPTWTCPHCSKVLDVEELFIDGYFQDILAKVPEDEDSVEMEADGSWKTHDGKITSTTETIAAAPPTEPTGKDIVDTAEPPAPKREADSASISVPPPSEEVPEIGPSADAEIVLLDDTPSPPPPDRRVVEGGQAGPVSASSMPASSTAPPPGLPPVPPPGVHAESSDGPVIDLTFSDDEDELPVAALARPQPRAAAPAVRWDIPPTAPVAGPSRVTTLESFITSRQSVPERPTAPPLQSSSATGSSRMAPESISTNHMRPASTGDLGERYAADGTAGSRTTSGSRLIPPVTAPIVPSPPIWPPPAPASAGPVLRENGFYPVHRDDSPRGRPEQQGNSAQPAQTQTQRPPDSPPLARRSRADSPGGPEAASASDEPGAKRPRLNGSSSSHKDKDRTSSPFVGLNGSGPGANISRHALPKPPGSAASTASTFQTAQPPSAASNATSFRTAQPNSAASDANTFATAVSPPASARRFSDSNAAAGHGSGTASGATRTNGAAAGSAASLTAPQEQRSVSDRSSMSQQERERDQDRERELYSTPLPSITPTPEPEASTSRAQAQAQSGAGQSSSRPSMTNGNTTSDRSRQRESSTPPLGSARKRQRTRRGALQSYAEDDDDDDDDDGEDVFQEAEEGRSRVYYEEDEGDDDDSQPPTRLRPRRSASSGVSRTQSLRTRIRRSNGAPNYREEDDDSDEDARQEQQQGQDEDTSEDDEMPRRAGARKGRAS